MPKTVRASAESTASDSYLMFDAQIGVNTLFGDSAWDLVSRYTKIRAQMVSSKDHTDISPDNIFRQAVRSLSTDEQHLYED
jgi:hypothetical protein